MTRPNLLVTGGTGTFGHALLHHISHRDYPYHVTVFSRDEFKQFEMARIYPDGDNVRYVVGDVRDLSRVYDVMKGMDYVIHAAALKQVPVCEANPTEAVSINVTGTANVIRAARAANVRVVTLLSTDKAVSPVNLYGMTKALAEKLFTNLPSPPTRHIVVRYGNVVGSRGSVIPYFLSFPPDQSVPITHKEMTRFWVTPNQAVDFVMDEMRREIAPLSYIAVPKLRSFRVVDLAAVLGRPSHSIIGIRPGEKVHEVLVSPDEAGVQSLEDRYIISPRYRYTTNDELFPEASYAAGVAYSSDKFLMSVEELQRRVKEVSDGAEKERDIH